MADEQIVTNIVANADFSGLTSDLRRVTAQLAVLQEQANATNKSLANQIAVMNRQFGDTLRSTGQFTSHFVSIGSDVEKFGKNLDAGRGKLRDFYGAWQGYQKQAGGLIRDLARQQVQLQNSILQPLGRSADGMLKFAVHVPQGLDTIKNKSALAKQELMIMNKVVQEGANQLINWGKNTQWAGRQLTVGLTVPLAAFGKVAADSFRQADEELTRLTKVYGDLAQTSSAQLKQVRQDVSATARELSASMGASYKDTLALSADIAATGKTGNELLGSIKETTRLSILGEVDRQEAMKATLAIQSAFKQNTDELAGSINFLNAVENQTSTSLADLVEAIPKAGPVVKGLGGSIKDLALYLTAMREGGISASEGANALKSGLASLINPTKVAVGQFKSFGIDLLGIVNNNAGNVTGTLLELQKALDTLDPLSKQKAIEQLFGKFQFSRMNALFENLGKQGSQTLKVLELMKASSSDLANIAGRELSQVTESASGKYKRALESLKADLASTGEQFLKISTYVLNFVDKIVNFANNLPGPIKSILGFFGGLTAIAGPLIMLTGVLGNFFGYIIKGVSHFKALFRGAEGWKMLTPEILAANNAGDLAEKTFYSDAKAAAVLNQALRDLTAQYDALAVRAQSGAVSVAPLLNGMANKVGVQRVVDPTNPLAGAQGTRASGHMVPRKIGQPGTIFGLVPTAIPVNAAIGENPMIYSQGDMPNVPGLTSINATRNINGQKMNVQVSTGIVAQEAAKHHAYMAALAMQSKEEVALLKKTIATTGAASQEFMSTFDDILPITTQITNNAAAESAKIVADLKAGALTVAQAREKIIALNLAIETELGTAVSSYAAKSGRTVNLTQVPTLNQPVQSPTGKSNMRELFKERQGGFFSKLAGLLGVRTSGAGYNVQTTMPKRLAHGAVSLNKGVAKFGSGATSIKNPLRLASMLRDWYKYSSKVGGLRTPNTRGTGSGPSTIGGASEGVIPFSKLYKTNAKIYSDPEYAGWITPTQPGYVLAHAYSPAFEKATSRFQRYGSSPSVNKAQLQELGISSRSKKDLFQLLPTSLVKTPQAWNDALKSGAHPSTWTPITGDDLTGLMLFLKSQGLKLHQAKTVANRTASMLNHKIFSSQGLIDEKEFGRLVNYATVRGIRSATMPTLVSKFDPFGSDAHSRNRGAGQNPDIAIELGNGLQSWPGHQDGVTKLPGYGGGDIIPSLLEPGESVVTKTATSGNEKSLSMMNNGISLDKLMGFRTGVVGVGTRLKMAGWLPGKASSRLNYDPMTGELLPGPAPSRFGSSFGSQMAGSMVGGSVGAAVGGQTGATIGSMAGMFAPSLISKIVTATKSAGGFLKVVMNIGKFLKAWSIPTAIITVLALVGKKLWDMHKAAEAVGKANRLAFGGTKESFASVGINNYTSLTDRIKQLNKEMKLHQAQVASTYGTYTKNGPSGVTLTINQLNQAVKNAKTNQKEYVEAFNNIDSSNVVDYAAKLKAQFVGMGLSATDAANQIYAIVQASDKASQAVAAVSSDAFRSIQKNTDGIKFLTTALRKELGSKEFNGEEFARGLDTLLNTLLNYKNALVGTKDTAGNIQDEADALAATLKEIASIQGSNKDLTTAQLTQLKDQNLVYAGILGYAESLQSITAKILMYQSGLGTMVDLSKMGKEEAIAFANNLSIVQNAMNSITESGDISKNPLFGLKTLIDKAADAQQKATAIAKKAKAVDEEYYKNKIKSIDKVIAKIKEEADNRIKLLQLEQQAIDYNDELRKAKLAYEQALASGDMVAAAEAQADVQKLISDRQRNLTIQNIQDRADEAVKKKEAERQALQDEMDKLNTQYNKIQANAAQTTADLQTLQGYRDTLEAIALRSRKTGVSTSDAKEISNIIEEMKNKGGAIKQAALDLIAKNPSTSEYLGGGMVKQKSFAQTLVDNLNKELNNTGNQVFEDAVNKFDEAVNKFLGNTDTNSKRETGQTGEAKTYTAKTLKKASESFRRGDPGTGKYSDGTITYDIFTWNGKTYARDPLGRVFLYDKNAKDPIGDQQKLANGGPVRHFDPGGPVSGPGTGTSDSIPAMLSNGEYVIKADSVAKYGIDTFDAYNAQKLHKGGPAGHKHLQSGHMSSAKKTGWLQDYANNLTAAGQARAELVGRSKWTAWAAGLVNDPLGFNGLIRKLAGTDDNGSTLAAALFFTNFMGLGIGQKLGQAGKLAGVIPEAGPGAASIKNMLQSTTKAKQVINSLYRRKDLTVGENIYPTYKMHGQEGRIAFQGFKEDLSKLADAGIKIVPTTPEGLLEEALRLNPSGENLAAMLDNFKNRKIGRKERIFLDEINAATGVNNKGKATVMTQTDGFAMILSALSGNKNAQSILKIKRNYMYEIIKRNKLNEKKSLHKSSYPEDTELPDTSSISVFHSTKYPVVRDAAGDISFYPYGHFQDTATGAPRSSFHTTLEAGVSSHAYGSWADTNNRVITPLSSMIKDNSLPYNFNSSDTWWQVDPGKSIKVSNGVVIKPYTNIASYYRNLLHAGIIKNGQKAPLLSIDPIHNDIFTLHKPRFTPSEVEEITDLGKQHGMVIRSDYAAENGNKALEDLAEYIAKKKLGTNPNLYNMGMWGLEANGNNVRQNQLYKLADILGLRQKIHMGSDVQKLETNLMTPSSKDSQWNMFGLNGLSGNSLEAMRYSAWFGRFKTNIRNLMDEEDFFGTSAATGGYIKNGKLVKNMRIPKFEDGINLVPQDMMALIHKNEAVVPANMNPFNPNANNATMGGAQYHVNVTLNGSDLSAQDVAREIDKQMRLREIMNGRSITR